MSYKNLEEVYDDGNIRIDRDPCGDGLPLRITVYDKDGDDSEYEWLDDEGVEAILKAFGPAAQATSAPAGVSAADVSFNESVLRLAALHSREVTFRYVKPDGSSPTPRTVIPFEIQEIKGNRLVLTEDHDREDYRAYRLDRIRGDVEFTGS